MEKQSSNRTESIRIRLSPELMERYEHQASRLGMTPSTLGAFIVGAWVKTQEDQLRMQSVAVMDAARKMLSHVEGLDLESLTRDMLDGMAPALHEAQAKAKGQDKGGE